MTASGRFNLTVGRRFISMLVVYGLVAWLGATHLASTRPSLRSMFETLAACTALAAGAALWFEARRTRQLRTALIFVGLAVLGAVDIVALAGPAAAGQSAATALGAAPALAMLFTATCFVAAACVSTHEIPRVRRLLLVQGAVVLCFFGFIVASVLAITDELIGAGGNASNAVVLGTSVPLLVLAAVWFLRQSGNDPSGLTVCLAGAAMLLAVGAAERLLLPTDIASGVAPSVMSRLAAFSLLALYGVRQFNVRRRDSQRAAADLERSRLARDLHDGLCQDLAFIAANAERLASQLGDDDPVIIAARRALAVSRGALASLSDQAEASVSTALSTVAAELSERFGIAIHVHGAQLELPPADRDDLLRIVREAIVNAVKHGGASHVDVWFDHSPDGELVLRISADGSCVELPAMWHEGFGMASMRLRATMLGGTLDARARPNGGTELEVIVR